MTNGILLMGISALVLMIFSRGSIVFLVTMYAISGFITFSLSQFGMARFFYKNRANEKNWKQHIPIHIIGFVLCNTILVITIYEKIGEGGWFTLFLTSALVGLCFLIHGHYQKVTKGLRKLDTLLEVIPATGTKNTVSGKSPQNDRGATRHRVSWFWGKHILFYHKKFSLCLMKISFLSLLP